MTNIQEIDLKRPDFEATHPFARLFNFDHEKLVYFGDRSDDVKRLNELWSTWCACIGLVYLDAKAAKANVFPKDSVVVSKWTLALAMNSIEEDEDNEGIIETLQELINEAQESNHD